MRLGSFLTIIVIFAISGSASAGPAYNALVAKLRDIYALKSVELVVEWDSAVALPAAAATDTRETQTAALATAIQKALEDPSLGTAISKAKKELKSLGTYERANVRLAETAYTKAIRQTDDYVRRKSEALSRSYNAILQARKKNEGDFKVWAPSLKVVFDIAKEGAKLVAPKMKPFDYIVADYCGMSNARVSEIMENVKEDLVPLVRRLRANGTAPDTSILDAKLDPKKLSELMNSIASDLGLNPDSTRIDKSTDFTSYYSIARTDNRLGLSVQDDNLKSAVQALMYAAGGALASQGQPKTHPFEPVSVETTMAFKQATTLLYQSRLLKSRPFAAYLLPKLKRKFPGQYPPSLTVDTLYGALSAIPDPSLIRREAGEPDYVLHTAVRREIEDLILRGALAVADIPKAWSAKYRKYLGVTPKNDNEASLQDVHWTQSAVGVGAFSAYGIGAMAAVQLYDAAVRKVAGLEAAIASGNFQPLRDWMTTNVWSKGSLYPTLDELLKSATGKPLDHNIFVKQMTKKFSALYGI